jgi:thioredoxin-like negative regulator of GroEL
MAVHAEQPTLLVFARPTDGRCRRVEGYIAQVLQRRRNHDTFSVRTISTEARPDLIAHLRVDQVPTLMVLEQGVVRRRLVNPSGVADIRTFLDPWLR